jgi:adenylate cyclase class 1
VSFSKCCLESTRFENVLLIQGAFTNCCLEKSEFNNVDGDSAIFINSTLFNAWFYKSRFPHSRFSGIGFTGSRFLSCDFSKCDFSFSNITAVFFHICDLSHSTVNRTDFVHTGAMASNFKEVDTQNASSFKLCNLNMHSKDWDDLVIPPVYFEKKLLASRWLTLLILIHEMEKKRNQFLARNRTAVDRALDAFNTDQEDLFHLVPFLIHQPRAILPVERLGEDGALPDTILVKKGCSGISCYKPSPGTMDIARKHLGVAKVFGFHDEKCHIEGLFTIGSVGSIAQGQDSDIDYWVCVDTKSMAPESLSFLRLKLASIEKWAKTRFSSEIHFFITDIDSVKEGHFGESDFESSGSAQSMILKEEFYRTMILVSGKIPFWSVTPDWVDGKLYPLLYHVASRFHSDYLDLGHVGDIPPGEYFGASMWQLFKSLKSPYKSVMKMALLEKYISEGKDGALLCDVLKKRRGKGKNHFRKDDPYILLFEETSSHYRKSGQTDTVDLIRHCFFLKMSISSPKHLERSVFKHRKLAVERCMEFYNWSFDEIGRASCRERVS